MLVDPVQLRSLECSSSQPGELGQLVPTTPALPLLGRRIVVTRPADQAASFCERLVALGAQPIVFPTVTIQPADPAPLDAALQHLQEYTWILFTSVNGVSAFWDRLTALGLQFPPMKSQSLADPRMGAIPNLLPHLAAIGPATAAALAERGAHADVVPEEYVAEALIPLLEDVAGQRILLPRADIARRMLAEELRARGAIVEEIAAYHTVPSAEPPPDIRDADVITFTSSSTVRGFVAGLEASRQLLPARAAIVCIGPITARTCREYGLPVTAVAAEYTLDGLMQAILGVVYDQRYVPADPAPSSAPDSSLTPPGARNHPGR